jgi:nucleoside-diphosphate-sugar epimerase
MSLFESFRDQLCGSRVLVTGGSGRVGRHLVSALLECNARVAILSRSHRVALDVFDKGDVEVRAGDLALQDSLDDALAGVEILFHLASFSPLHPRGSIYEDPGHWPVTAEGTKNLVRAAAKAGCGRIVYFSSIKAMGEEAGSRGFPDDETLPCAPETLYGRAKLAAEREIISATEKGLLCGSVIRLPMVYGLDGFGNLARMIDAIARGHFPPFPRLENHRSALHVLDAVQASLLCATHEEAIGKVYLVTDGASYSTRWIYEQICVGLGRDIPRWTLPFWCWELGARLGTVAELLAKRPMPLTLEALRKLSGNAWFSSKRIETELRFRSRFTLGPEIQAMAERYRTVQPAD